MTTQTAPKTVRDWQLYSGTKGASEAARKLTSALKKAEKLARKDLLAAEHANKGNEAAETILSKHYYETVYPVMLAYSNQGAADTEPRCVAQEYLEKVAHEYGFYGYLSF